MPRELLLAPVARRDERGKPAGNPATPAFQSVLSFGGLKLRAALFQDIDLRMRHVRRGGCETRGDTPAVTQETTGRMDIRFLP